MLIGLPVTVIGAGVAGLAVAMALAQRGAQVRVLEQAPELTEVGAGLQISPNGVAVLDALGLGGQIRARAVVSQAVELRDFRRGTRVLRIDLNERADSARPFLLIHRAQLIDILSSGARDAGVQLDLGTKADLQAIDPSLIIGADGLRSGVRTLLNGDDAPFFTGQVAWRALIADDRALPEAHVFMGPGRHLVTYALANGLRNIVAVEERTEWVDEGWSQTDDPANMRCAFSQFSPEVRGWLDQVQQVNLWGLFHHPVAANWHDDQHAILGDAAHPTLPFLAQGANLALEDSWVLADCLGTLPQPDALHLFQSRRRNRAVRVIDAANANARNYHLRNPIMRGLTHTMLRVGSKISPQSPLKRFAWLYDHDVSHP